MTTVLDETNVSGSKVLYHIAAVLAAVSGTFCFLFCTLLAVSYHGLLSSNSIFAIGQEALPSSNPSYRSSANDSFNRLPTDYHSFLTLRNEIALNRQNDELKTTIRQLDHELRTEYFQRRIIVHRLAHLLIAASVLFFISMRTVTTLKRQLPDPGNIKTNKNKNSSPRNSWHLTAVASWLLLFGGLYVGLLLTAEVPKQLDEQISDQSAAIELTEELLAKNWVSFRNFDGNGVGFSDNPPIQWDGTTGENIVWKSPVPLPGHSSPVIWTDDAGNGKLFLTGANLETQKVFCYDIKDGTLLWEKDVTRPETKLTEEFEDTGYAAPTPAVDGQHVYAMFANGELVAVDFTGNIVWRKSFGIPDNHYGFASSPALYFDKLIVQFDNGDGSEGNSKLVALELDTGDVLWTTKRDLPNSWSSPTIKKIGDSYQVITCSLPFMVAYNPENGEEIWRCKCLSGEVAPSVVSWGNLVLTANDPRTAAIDATGTGDVTTTHILWTGVGSISDAPSPLASEKFFLTISSSGWLSGYDPTVIDPTRKRARYWELEVGNMASFYSSPLRVGTYVYLFDKTEVDEARGNKPKAFVVDLSKVEVSDNGELTQESAAAMIIAENPMPEPCVTCPAMLNNRLYIRGATTLYCIGEK